MSGEPRLLIAAHGTESAAGSATTARLVEAIQAARPWIRVALCFLDVADPRLANALDAAPGPTVLLPLLLSTGYHVQTDIPATVAGRPGVVVARHLGPDPRMVDVLVERLADVPPGASTVLAASGSSRPEAAVELASTAELLADRLGVPVQVVTMGDDLRAFFAALPGPVRVATYLLAEGRFFSALHAAVDGYGAAAAPLGVHPALVELVWARYDAAR